MAKARWGIAFLFLVFWASFAGAGTLTLSWDNPPDNTATFLEVHRKAETCESATLPFTLLDTVSEPVSTYVDTTPLAGTLYCYRVRAGNADGVSAFSNDAELPLPGTPLAPSNLVVTGGQTAPPVNITFLEAGTNATYGTEAFTVSSGAPSSSATLAHTGSRSLRIFQDDKVYHLGIFSDSGSRVSFYSTFGPTLPSSSDPIFVVSTSGVSSVFALKSTATGVLQLWSSYVGGSQIGTDATTSALVAGSWARISLAWVITNSTTYEIRVWVDGALAISATNGVPLNNTGSNGMLFVPNNGYSAYHYMSDFYADDSAGLTDPGDIRVTAKLPASVNTGNFDTTVGTGAVNERPLSETNGMEDTGIAGDQQNYTLQTVSVGDVDLTGATIVGRSAWIWAKVSVASVAAKIMDNGSESAVALTTSSALYTLLTTSASYPSNAAGIGMRSSTTANTFLYECGTLIAYTPAAVGGFEPLVGPRFSLAGRRGLAR